MSDEIDLSHPKKWALQHLQKEWRHLKAAPLAFLIVGIIGAVLSYWITAQFVIPSKNASIETLHVSLAAEQSRNAELANENDRITKQNVQLKTAISDNAMPLKKRTLILAAQLNDYARRNSTHAEPSSMSPEWWERFDKRVSQTVHDFDEAGMHSEVLFQMLSSFSLPIPSTNIQAMANEFQKLAHTMKDDAPINP